MEENRELCFPEVLKSLIKRDGLRLDDLAAKIGTTKQAISTYTTGKSAPSYKTLVKIASFFGVSLDYLITGYNPENVKIREELGLDEEAIETLKAAVDGDFGVVWFILNTVLKDRGFYEALNNAENMAIHYRSIYKFLIEQRQDEGLGEAIGASVVVPADKMRDYFLRFFNEFPKHLDELAARQRQSVIELHERMKMDTQSMPDPVQDMIESPTQ